MHSTDTLYPLFHCHGLYNSHQKKLKFFQSLTIFKISGAFSPPTHAPDMPDGHWHGFHTVPFFLPIHIHTTLLFIYNYMYGKSQKVNDYLDLPFVFGGFNSRRIAGIWTF